MTQTTFKSERAAKMAVTKAAKAYETARNLRIEAAQQSDTLQDNEYAAFCDLNAVHSTAKAQGFYVPCRHLEYSDAFARATMNME